MRQSQGRTAFQGISNTFKPLLNYLFTFSSQAASWSQANNDFFLKGKELKLRSVIAVQ